jgi:glycosyltransferase involved in cell wall biosynthesis
MLVSILIANYNNGKYFEDCWNSLLLQTYSNWEAIIVDDCSTDNSKEVVLAITKSDSRVKFFTNEQNKGCGYTKRRCTEFANGEILGFLDPDDTIPSHAIERMVNAFKENLDVALVYSKHKVFDENLKYSDTNYDLKQIDSFDPLFFNKSGIISAFSCFKKEAYLNTNGIDPYMLRAVDQDLYLKVYEQGKVLALNEYLYNYRIHRNGIAGEFSGNVSPALYWQWYAINAAAKRRGVYVEKMFVDAYVQTKEYSALKKKMDLILNSGSYRLAKKISNFYQNVVGFFSKKKAN